MDASRSQTPRICVWCESDSQSPLHCLVFWSTIGSGTKSEHRCGSRGLLYK